VYLSVLLKCLSNPVYSSFQQTNYRLSWQILNAQHSLLLIRTWSQKAIQWGKPQEYPKKMKSVHVSIPISSHPVGGSTPEFTHKFTWWPCQRGLEDYSETAKKWVTFQHDGAPSRARVQLIYGCGWIIWFMVDLTIVIIGFINQHTFNSMVYDGLW
jgi:hypothetical protein